MVAAAWPAAWPAFWKGLRRVRPADPPGAPALPVPVLVPVGPVVPPKQPPFFRVRARAFAHHAPAFRPAFLNRLFFRRLPLPVAPGAAPAFFGLFRLTFGLPPLPVFGFPFFGADQMGGVTV
jgi:hypothetical protein